MKSRVLLSVILAAAILGAQEYKYEITPQIGYNIAEGNLGIENQLLMGGAIQYNDVDCLLKPELSILYSEADYENSNIETDIYRIAINGVHEYGSFGPLIPLAKIGLGYETIDQHFAQNKDSIFVDAGIGAKVPFGENLALKLEAVYMLKNNDNRWDNNLALLAGISFAFGPKAQPEPEPMPEPKPEPVDGDDDNDGVLNSKDKCPTTPAGTKVDSNGCKIDGDDDNDGVLNSKDRCPNTPAGTKVDSNGCKIDGDDDKDGVLNSKDKCPTTPMGNTVDDEGCTKIVNLHINFETGSYRVDEASKQRVSDFANFLKARSEFKAKIVGHTDSVGTQKNNQILSQNRADAVVKLLIEQGIDAARISALGMGENAPITTNDTAEGRAQNRRIEAELIRE